MSARRSAETAIAAAARAARSTRRDSLLEVDEGTLARRRVEGAAPREAVAVDGGDGRRERDAHIADLHLLRRQRRRDARQRRHRRDRVWERLRVRRPRGDRELIDGLRILLAEIRGELAAPLGAPPPPPLDVVLEVERVERARLRDHLDARRRATVDATAHPVDATHRRHHLRLLRHPALRRRRLVERRRRGEERVVGVGRRRLRRRRRRADRELQLREELGCGRRRRGRAASADFRRATVSARLVPARTTSSASGASASAAGAAAAAPCGAASIRATRSDFCRSRAAPWRGTPPSAGRR